MKFLTNHGYDFPETRKPQAWKRDIVVSSWAYDFEPPYPCRDSSRQQPRVGLTVFADSTSLTNLTRNGKQDTFWGSKMIGKDFTKQNTVLGNKCKFRMDHVLNVKGRFVERKWCRNYYKIIAIISSSFERKVIFTSGRGFLESISDRLTTWKEVTPFRWCLGSVRT